MKLTGRTCVVLLSCSVALQRLGANSGVQIAYSSDLIAGTGTVSCSCADVTVGQALDSLLSGTGLRYEETRGRVVVRPEARRTMVPDSDIGGGALQNFGWILGHVLAEGTEGGLLESIEYAHGRYSFMNRHHADPGSNGGRHCLIS